MKTLSEYKRTKDVLICVDSDGCAMDTMDIKHFLAFGPCMVDEWELDEWREPILKRWNEINLYSITRGINRFLGLAKALSEINDTYKKIEGIEELSRWVKESPELSGSAVKRAIEEYPDNPIFTKALNWSNAVNLAIEGIKNEDKRPFPMVREALEYAHAFADIAIVSSANLDAVLEEWSLYGLLDHVDVVLSQNDGSKAFCIGELLKHGYNKGQVLMCGDAPGDLAAAEKNGVHFYPILVGHERESWDEFINIAFPLVQTNSYGDSYGADKRAQFLKNLGE